MNNIRLDIRIAQLTFDPNQPLRDLLLNGLTSAEYDIWQTLGPAPKRPFPVFDEANIPGELGRIKQKLQNKADHQPGKRLNFKKSGQTERSKGLLLVTDFAHGGPVGDQDIRRKEAMDQHEIDDAMTVEVMKPYFRQARATQSGVGPRGVPHDYDTSQADNNHRSLNPNAWLPGLFLIDEIWEALLSTIDDKIAAVNSLVVKLQSVAPNVQNPALIKAKQEASEKLDNFAKAISRNEAQVDETGDAGKYLPFINHQEKPQDPDHPPQHNTYIRVVRVDEFVLGVVVQVGDWAGGSHSSGSAIH